jgi:hypothetical protein
MTVITGTPDTRTVHTPSLSAAGVAFAYAIPAIIGIAGVATLGWDAISWLGALIWGLVAGAVMLLAIMMGRGMGMTRVDFLDLLGSMFAPAHSRRSRAIGLVIHEVDSVLLAAAWAYGVAMAGLPANWLTAMVWGALLWVLSLIVMTSIGGVHPAIRSGTEEDPGTAAANFGPLTPLGSLMGHLVYGAVLGLLYQSWPLT